MYTDGWAHVGERTKFHASRRKSLFELLRQQPTFFQLSAVTDEDPQRFALPIETTTSHYETCESAAQAM